MPLTAAQRIEREMTRPQILQLWEALQPLKSVLRFMNSGAHPDDETTAMLAALGLRDGLSLSYACANRGEGGQNDIGTERTEDLGTLRTAEMERAADRLNVRLYWLSETPDDAVFDFGFSKSGKETLGKWGADRTLARLVDIVRRERPDILCPTFLDIPGQHGHHRAMTETAHRVMDAAADPDFPDCDLPVWQISKLYLPAWSGAGRAYDDDLPPPPTTIVIAGKGCDPVSGWSWERIAQQSRMFHKTQGMGFWVPAGEERDWPLHLADCRVEGGEDALLGGLPATLGDLSLEADAASTSLQAAQSAIDKAQAAFPDRAMILHHANAALSAIRNASAACPEGFRERHGHRLARKEIELSHVIRLAAGIDVWARLDTEWFRPGDSTALTIETRSGDAETVNVGLALPDGWEMSGDRLIAGNGLPPTDPYPAEHDPAMPRLPAVRVEVTAHGVTSHSLLPLEQSPVILPAKSAQITPQMALLNTASPSRDIDVGITDIVPAGANADLSLPDGWSAQRTASGQRVSAPTDVPIGLHELALTLDNQPASVTRRISHPHVGPLARSSLAILRVRALPIELAGGAIGYIGSGNDAVAHWLSAMGADVRDLSDRDLSDDAVLSELDTIVIGIFTLRFRPTVIDALPRLHQWVEAGGNLVTLYHRPWDNWDAETTPPKPLEIGQPSLRWRVTDENADVTHLLPDHPLLTYPNRIGPEDWSDWHKERGLYFASDWDPAYEALLEMADPDEDPHRGALLSARIGKGRHTHCALILHHQMDKLVPGGFRLMANLVAPVRD